MLGPDGYRQKRQNLGSPADGRGSLNRDSDEKRIFEINELPCLCRRRPRSIPTRTWTTPSRTGWTFRTATKTSSQPCDSSTTTASRTHSDQDGKSALPTDSNVDGKRTTSAGCEDSAAVEREAYFRRVAKGLRAFVQQRATSTAASRHKNASSRGACAASLTDGVAKNPYTARFGALDLYWLARLLQAEVSSVGVVTYAGPSWIWLLAEKARQDGEDAEYRLEETEPVLRAVFDYACDLAQNAIAIACDEREHAMRVKPFRRGPGRR